MKLESRYGLPFTSATLEHQGKSINLHPVLVDTGSSTTVLLSDIVEAVGITPRPDDILNKLRGIGGTEVVFTRIVDRISVGEASLPEFEIEVGGMDYGFEIQGILGMDYLRRTGAVIDLCEMTLEFKRE
jgi:predicted aspartyl protease